MIDLVLVGNGGHARDITQIINDINHHRPTFNVVATLDDGFSESDGRTIDIANYPDTQYVICVNDGKVRRRIDETISNVAYKSNKSFKAANLIHPTAYIGDNCRYQDGLVMGPYAVVTTRISLGLHVHMNSHASINQMSSIGHYVTLSPGARVCGDCDIGDEVNMGANSVVINVKTVGDRATIGAGAVVIRDVEPNTTVVGVPARELIKDDGVVWG